MSQRDVDGLCDIADAIEVIKGDMTRGGLDDGLVYGAVRARLIEIGGAVKSISPEVRREELGVRVPRCGGVAG